MKELQTLAVFLGPYRNLTTLTASMLAMHPHCQVLNHGRKWLAEVPEANFLLNYSNESLQRFYDFAIEKSQVFETDRGGTITVDHAFENHEIIRDTYEKRFGDAQLKDEIRCLVWKESMYVSNLIRNETVNLSALFEQNDQLRFLMPIRNPIDCAISNCLSEHAIYFPGIKEGDSVVLVIERVLQEIRWFLSWKMKHPDRFFHYFQNDFSEQTLVQLAQFLKIEPFEDWIRDAAGCYQLKAPYEYEPQLLVEYRKLVETHFANSPALKGILLEFANDRP